MSSFYRETRRLVFRYAVVAIAAIPAGILLSVARLNNLIVIGVALGGSLCLGDALWRMLPLSRPEQPHSPERSYGPLIQGGQASAAATAIVVICVFQSAQIARSRVHLCAVDAGQGGRGAATAHYVRLG